MSVATPMQIEARLVELGKELDSVTQDQVSAEHEFFHAKGEYEVAFAAAKLRIANRYLERGVKSTVAEREDMATIECADQLRRLYTAEAVVKAARANAARVRTQIDIARSVGTSVRASLEM